MTGDDLVPFEYALLRAVPRIERGECVNVAVVLYCQARDVLTAAIHLDVERLRALDRNVELDAVRGALSTVLAVCSADPFAGELARMSPRQRFGWLTSPRSTMIQPGPVHCGLTASPEQELARLELALLR